MAGVNGAESGGGTDDGDDRPDGLEPAADADAPVPPDEAEETGPLRRCIATGVVQPKDGMIRFVVGPEGEIVPDLDECLPGRGLWVSADRAALAKAGGKGLFARAARRAVRVPPDLVERLERLLERRCLDRVGLARRAGQALAGFEKVREALRNGQVGRNGGPPGLLVEAADGSLDQRGKVAALAPGLPVVALFDSASLAAALGRDHAVHTVIARGKLASQLVRDAARLTGIRGFDVGVAGGPGKPTTEINRNR